MVRYWIWLSTRKHLNAKDKVAIYEHFASAESAYLADEYAYRQLSFLSDSKIESLLDKDLEDAERILLDCDNKRISILTYQDMMYPSRLKHIGDAPLLLYYDGRVPHVDNEVTIGMVGTRKPSGYGLKHAKELGYQMSCGGAIVVSGSAHGIDRASLEGALTGGKPVIAVLGNGIDVTYPTWHRSLYNDIRNHGCLFSEFPPGTPPLPENFPIRNRIISGLSLGIVVVEAPLKSGALNTARHAIDQGRDVFTIPGNLGVDTLQGNLRLLRDGAIMIENGSDVLREYVGAYPGVTAEYIKCDLEGVEDRKPTKELTPKTKTIHKAKVASKVTHVTTEQTTKEYMDIHTVETLVSPEGNAILRALLQGPLHIDDVIETTGFTASKVLSSITILEIQGYVKRLPGQRFELAEKG